MNTFSTTIRRVRLGLAMFASVFLWGSAGTARAGSTLWYNGDFNGVAQLANEQVTPATYNSVYDDFIVPTGQIWNINQVFSNNEMTTTVTQAYWEVRSGVSSGVAGTLLDSGTGAATQTPTGRSGPLGNEYTVAVTGLNVTLSAGTYFLTVNPLDSAPNSSFITTTSGMNAVGMPPGNDDNSFFNSTIFSTNYEQASDFVGFPADFSMGVSGLSQSVPEPTTLLLGLIGALTGFGCAWCRRRPRVR